ncbi:hypothetical protein BJ875DRAFT_474721 [Amylocarpus encephaloides]|uniref:Uncharacterized protein n=1 Tax=Amylocarpus encephaloides TaxID=45428 RepID=A0A9P7YAK5_9HELO|nr:hypothetical protein BJ875DRAFT_474721 [Amylocarpus encephaloides]
MKQVNFRPLNSRSWVLQEQALSPRVLYFIETAIFWDCRQERWFGDGHYLGSGVGHGDIRMIDELYDFENLDWI